MWHHLTHFESQNYACIHYVLVLISYLWSVITFVDRSPRMGPFFSKQTFCCTLYGSYIRFKSNCWLFCFVMLAIALMPICSFMRTLILYSRSGLLTSTPASLRDSFRFPAATWHLLWPPAVSFHNLYITQTHTQNSHTYLYWHASMCDPEQVKNACRYYREINYYSCINVHRDKPCCFRICWCKMRINMIVFWFLLSHLGG